MAGISGGSKNFQQVAVSETTQVGKDGPILTRTTNETLSVRADDNASLAWVSVRDAVAGTHAVTLSQLQQYSAGVQWKQPVRAASVGNVNIASAPASIDGVTLNPDDRILLKNQSSPVENGIYRFISVGFALSRADDMDNGSNAASSAMFVSEGTVNADVAFVETADPAIVGTDALTFTQFASIIGGVTSVASLGAGESLVVNGTGAVTLRSITEANGTIDVQTVGDEIRISVPSNGIGSAQIADQSITVAKTAPLVTTAALRVAFSEASPPDTVVGALPANAEVVRVRVNTGGFTGGVAPATITVGTAVAPTALMDVGDSDLSVSGLNYVELANTALSSSTIVLNVDPQSNTGTGFVEVFYIVTA